MTRYDFAIVGAGIAGASLAAMLAPHASVLVLESEDTPGYHATGRSAAFWAETYGGPAIQPLTTASGPVLEQGGYLSPLGSLHIGREADGAEIEAFVGDFANVALRRVDPVSIVPGLRSDWKLGVLEPSCAYIDVAALHGDYLAASRRTGARIETRASLNSAVRQSGGWNLDTAAGAFSATVLIDAGGAWADEIAHRAGVAPLGIRAFRRTMAQLRTDPAAPAGLPHVTAIDGSLYFKPEAGGKLWLSPHDEIATDPCDAAPDELDVAMAIDRFERVVDWRIDAVERKWAGLRSFAPDRLPVYGFDMTEPAFFWFAGQGGFGIQTAPAAAMIAAALLLDRAPDQAVAGIDTARYAPGRFAA